MTEEGNIEMNGNFWAVRRVIVTETVEAKLKTLMEQLLWLQS